MAGGEKEGKRCELQLPGVANVTMRRGQEVNRVLGTLKETGSERGGDREGRQTTP